MFYCSFNTTFRISSSVIGVRNNELELFFSKKLSTDMLSTTGIFFAKSEPMFTKKSLNSLTIVCMSSTTLPLQTKEGGIFIC